MNLMFQYRRGNSCYSRRTLLRAVCYKCSRDLIGFSTETADFTPFQGGYTDCTNITESASLFISATKP